MNCPHCGSPITLEDSYCTYCGEPNEQAARHADDLKRFEEEYQKTKETVLTRTRQQSRISAILVFFSLLIILNVAAGFFAAKAWDLGYSYQKHKVNQQAGHHKQVLEQYLTDENYTDFYRYSAQNNLYYSEELNCYTAIDTAAADYTYFLTSLNDYLSDKKFYFEYESQMTTLCKSLASNAGDIYEIEDRYAFDKERYLSEDMLVHIHNMQSRITAMLQTYCNLTEEDVQLFLNSSDAKRISILERGLKEAYESET